MRPVGVRSPDQACVIIRCKNLTHNIRDCLSLSFGALEETLKAVGPFYLVSGGVRICNNLVSYARGSKRFLSSFLTSSHWLPLVGCGVPVGLNDGSMKPSLAYV